MSIPPPVCLKNVVCRFVRLQVCLLADGTANTMAHVQLSRDHETIDKCVRFQTNTQRTSCSGCMTQMKQLFPLVRFRFDLENTCFTQ